MAKIEKQEDEVVEVPVEAQEPVEKPLDEKQLNDFVKEFHGFK